MPKTTSTNYCPPPKEVASAALVPILIDVDLLTVFSTLRRAAPTTLAALLIGGPLLAPSFTTGVVLQVIDKRAERIERTLTRALLPLTQTDPSR